MNYLDIYYRAFIDYRKNTTDNHDCTVQRSTTAKANSKDDEIIVTRQICDIETDWIEAIEEGLVHVDKAIREDRQFIRSNGEVVDIEKVKNVSKDSVEHLARHSNLITKYHEGEDVIPDRLYTVERLSDYAVYENKFLYMLLCYLRDFITMRYNKILDNEYTYQGSLSMDKSIVMTKRKIDFKLSLSEEKKDDEYLKENSKSRDLIRRISDILELTHSQLSTPLMQEVSKSPMLKPPVTKTNVLRMNHNFRGALALYEYISAYDKDGYSVRQEEQRISPFKHDVADEFAEIAMLSSFLTYEYGLNVRDSLRKSYENEELRRKEEELKRHLEQLKAMRRRLKESGESPDEYILALEKTNRMLEQNTEKLSLARQEIEELNSTILDYKAKKARLEEKVAGLNHEIDQINKEHEEKLILIENKKQEEIKALNEQHERKIDEIKEIHSTELQKICDECDLKVEQIKERIDSERRANEEAMQELKEKFRKDSLEIEEQHAFRVAELKANWKDETTKLAILCQRNEEKIASIEKENEKLIDARRLAEARLIAIRQEHGLTSPPFDFSSEESFEELEKQLDVFEKFFNTEWKKTKTAIRKNAIKEFFDNLKMAKHERKIKATKGELVKKKKDEEKSEQNIAKDEKPSEEIKKKADTGVPENIKTDSKDTTETKNTNDTQRDEG